MDNVSKREREQEVGANYKLYFFTIIGGRKEA